MTNFDEDSSMIKRCAAILNYVGPEGIAKILTAEGYKPDQIFLWVSAAEILLKDRFKGVK